MGQGKDVKDKPHISAPFPLYLEGQVEHCYLIGDGDNCSFTGGQSAEQVPDFSEKLADVLYTLFFRWCASSRPWPFPTCIPTNTERLFNAIVLRTCLGFLQDLGPLICVPKNNEILLIHDSEAGIFAKILDAINKGLSWLSSLYLSESL